MNSEASLELVNQYLNLQWCIEHCISPWKYDSTDSCLYLAINDVDLVEPIHIFLSKRLEGRVKKLIFEYRDRGEIEDSLGIIKEKAIPRDSENNNYSLGSPRNIGNSRNRHNAPSAYIYWNEYVHLLSNSLGAAKSRFKNLGLDDDDDTPSAISTLISAFMLRLGQLYIANVCRGRLNLLGQKEAGNIAILCSHASKNSDKITRQSKSAFSIASEEEFFPLSQESVENIIDIVISSSIGPDLGYNDMSFDEDGPLAVFGYFITASIVYDVENSTHYCKDIVSSILRYEHMLIHSDGVMDQEEEKFYRRLELEINGYVEKKMFEVMGLASNIKLGDSGSKPTNPSLADEKEVNAKQLPIVPAIDQLSSLVGLQNIKADVHDMKNYLTIQSLRRKKGLAVPSISNHMVFYGNPGTGKTSVARIMGMIFKELGILSKGHLVEVDRSGLVGGYLGQTAIKTKEVLDRSLGGILFIDEAYTLSPRTQGDGYGSEAIDTILKYMEDNRGDIVVIVAGYSEPMTSFLSSNPGLKSRFNKYLDFPDYEPGELAEIFLKFASDVDYVLEEDTIRHIENICEEIYASKGSNFGNGRTIRNLFEKSLVNQSNRLVKDGVKLEAAMNTLAKTDILIEDALKLV